MTKLAMPHLALLAILLLASTANGDEPSVSETSYVLPDDSRVLRHELVVEAPLEEVWRAFTTAEGLKEWAVPTAWVDFRLGGSWESSYRLDAQKGDPANIISRILSYQPMEMLSLQTTQAPPGFEHAEVLKQMFSVFTFEEVADGRTRIRSSGIGYGRGEAFDKLYEFFRAGNAWTLAQLQERFRSGPVDWVERLGQMPGREAAQSDKDR